MVDNAFLRPNVTPQPDQKEGSDLPDVIKPGGTVDTMLRSPTGDHSQRQSMSHELTGIQQSFRRTMATTPPTWDGSARDKVLAKVIASRNGGIFNPMLRYSIACHENFDQVCTPLYQLALEEFLKTPEKYRGLFGDFIPTELLRDAQHSLERQAYNQGTNATVLDDWPVFEQTVRREAGQEYAPVGCMTGIGTLDTALNGMPGVTFIGGTTGVGKTTLMLLTMIESLKADENLAVLFYTLDMSKLQMYKRLVCCLHDIRRSDLPEHFRGEEATGGPAACSEAALQDVLSRCRFIESNFPHKKDDCYWANRLVTDANKLIQASGREKLVVFIDSFQRMGVPSTIYTAATGGQDEPDQQKLSSENDRDAFRLDQIKEFRHCYRSPMQPDGPPVIIASELRKTDSRRDDELSVDDLKGSARLAFDADNIFLMWSTSKQLDGAAKVPVILRIAKGRDGVVRRDVNLTFHHTHYRFTERGTKSTTKKVQQHKTAHEKLADEPIIDPLATN